MWDMDMEELQFSRQGAKFILGSYAMIVLFVIFKSIVFDNQ